MPTGALEEAGVLGSGPGQVRPHRLLFCSTPEGKTSIVRQIEPDLHIDGSGATIEELRRFMPQLLQVCGCVCVCVTLCVITVYVADTGVSHGQLTGLWLYANPLL